MDTLTPTEIATVDDSAVAAYIESNLTSDLVLRVLEQCLLEENFTYASLDFATALKDLQAKDAGRYHMLKALLEGFATKEGLVMLDPKLVTASYKQRMAELETLKGMSRFRRFTYRLGMAIQSLLTEKGETAAIQEAIQLTAEVQIAREEMAILEAKKASIQSDCNDMIIEASQTKRVVITAANEDAIKKSEEIYREARARIAMERYDAKNELRQIENAITEASEKARLRGVSVPAPARPRWYKKMNPNADESLSLSYSPSSSPSPSNSLSPSHSPSPEFDEPGDDFGPI